MATDISTFRCLSCANTPTRASGAADAGECTCNRTELNALSHTRTQSQHPLEEVFHSEQGKSVDAPSTRVYPPLATHPNPRSSSPPGAGLRFHRHFLPSPPLLPSDIVVSFNARRLLRELLGFAPLVVPPLVHVCGNGEI